MTKDLFQNIRRYGIDLLYNNIIHKVIYIIDVKFNISVKII